MTLGNYNAKFIRSTTIPGYIPGCIKRLRVAQFQLLVFSISVGSNFRTFWSAPVTWNINLLLTEREGRTGEYWPRSWQYGPSAAKLRSSLLYGTLSLIVKCTSGGLLLKMFVFSIYLWNLRKSSIFSASSESFNVKNDIIHTFRCFGCKFWICRPRSKTKIYGLDRFHGNGPYCKILTEKEPIRSQGFA